jgi:CO/xanthine dehydrogenase Mo-binding subunit
VSADYFPLFGACSDGSAQRCRTLGRQYLRDLVADAESDAGAQTVAEALGINEADVTVDVTLLGGGFGRKSKPDYVAEAALLSRMVGAPVKVTWTREDDIQHDYYHAICAQHLEAVLDRDGRANAWLDMAIDCGTIVNPDRVRAQLEGAVIMSIGNALYGKVTVKEGRIGQSNYTDYLVPRIDITPETYVYFVENTHPPGGGGEPGVPPTVPAICNAIHAATGKRTRALPVDPQLLKA